MDAGADDDRGALRLSISCICCLQIHTHYMPGSIDISPIVGLQVLYSVLLQTIRERQLRSTTQSKKGFIHE